MQKETGRDDTVSQPEDTDGRAVGRSWIRLRLLTAGVIDVFADVLISDVESGKVVGGRAGAWSGSDDRSSRSERGGTQRFDTASGGLT